MIVTKKRRGRNRKPSKYNKNVYRSLALVSQFGFTMLAPICLCTFGGIWLDRKFGTSWIAVLFFFIGALAGFGSVYRLARTIYEAKDPGNRADEEDKGKL